MNQNTGLQFSDFLLGGGKLNFSGFNDFDIEKAISLEQFVKEARENQYEIYTESDIKKFITDAVIESNKIQKGGDEKGGLDFFEKAKKDLSKLQKKIIINKNGKKQTVWVRVGEKPMVEREKKEEIEQNTTKQKRGDQSEGEFKKIIDYFEGSEGITDEKSEKNRLREEKKFDKIMKKYIKGFDWEDFVITGGGGSTSGNILSKLKELDVDIEDVTKDLKGIGIKVGEKQNVQKEDKEEGDEEYTARNKKTYEQAKKNPSDWSFTSGVIHSDPILYFKNKKTGEEGRLFHPQARLIAKKFSGNEDIKKSIDNEDDTIEKAMDSFDYSDKITFKKTGKEIKEKLVEVLAKVVALKTNCEARMLAITEELKEFPTRKLEEYETRGIEDYQVKLLKKFEWCKTYFNTGDKGYCVESSGSNIASATTKEEAAFCSEYNQCVDKIIGCLRDGQKIGIFERNIKDKEEYELNTSQMRVLNF